jgi:hypothetical protein
MLSGLFQRPFSVDRPESVSIITTKKTVMLKGTKKIYRDFFSNFFLEKSLQKFKAENIYYVLLP